MVTNGKLGDRCPDRFDLSGQLGAKDPLLRPADAEEQANEERLGATNAAVCPGDRRGVDLDEDLVVLWQWPLNLFESLHVWRSVPVVDNRSHAFLFEPLRVSTTFPVLRRDSTYLVASITSSSG